MTFPRLAVIVLLATAASQAAAAPVDFEKDVRPILTGHCVGCHGPDKQRGGLRLDLRESALKGGDSGQPAVKPRDIASSLLARVSSTDDETRMPPRGRLTEQQVATLREWVEGGADWPADRAGPARKGELVVTAADRDHWAFRPLARVVPPALPRVKNPVDAFVLAGLEPKKLVLTPQADRRTLVRRLTFDLHGLPPMPDEVDAFVADTSPAAYDRLVDRLLASPRYGERWGRHWLDVARYADSNGYERDADRPHAWPYRDFVIGALNDDLPYDTFLRWQVAGDELAPNDPRAAVATGFLTAGPVVVARTTLEEEQRRYRADELDDMVSTTATAALGLTVGCARCHDHKYDPIPTRDYYRFQAAFVGTKRVEDKPRDRVPETLRVRDTGLIPAPAWLLDRGDPMSRKGPVALGFLTVLTRDKTPERYLSDARERLPTWATSTGQRAALAAWLTDAEHGAGALAARVAVNWAWARHFGQGLVPTPGDFGTQGQPPSHPELLEWLAAEFVRSGWSLKALHRRIVTSATYKQGVAPDPTRVAADPDGRLWSRRRPTRLEAEALRDAMLSVAGVLNTRMGGPAVKPPVPAEAMGTAYNVLDPWPKDARDDSETRRRSVYVFVKRSLRQPLIEAFDGADPTVSCPRRNNTTVAPQALTLLNDPLVRRWAAEFASRLLKDAGDGDAAAVRRAYRLALSRDPRADELGKAVAFLRVRAAERAKRGDTPDGARAAALTDFAQVVFGLNEFLYVD